MLSEHDPTILFPESVEDEFRKEETAPPDVPAWGIVEVTKRIAAINHITDKIARLEVYKAETVAFYNNRIEQMNKTIEQIEGDLRVYMDYHGVTSIPTVQGTCVLVKRTKPVWDEDAAWEYINKTVPEDRKELVRIREELNKPALKERMKTDPGATYVTFETTEGVVLRKRGQ